jgi:hypothetical protein
MSSVYPANTNVRPGPNDAFSGTGQRSSLPGGPPPIIPNNRSPFAPQTGTTQSAQQAYPCNGSNGNDPGQPYPELGRAGSWFGWMLDWVAPRSRLPGTSANGNLPPDAAYLSSTLAPGPYNNNPVNGRSPTFPYSTTLPTTSIDPADPRDLTSAAWRISQPNGSIPVDPQIQEQFQRFQFDSGQSAIPRNAPGSMAQQGNSGPGGQQQPQNQFGQQPQSQFAQQPQNQFGVIGQQPGPNVGGAQQQAHQLPGNGNPTQQGMNAGQQGPTPLVNMPFNSGAPQNQQQAQQAGQNASMGQPSPFAAFQQNQGNTAQAIGQQPNVPNYAMPQVPPNMGHPNAAQDNANSASNMPQSQRQANNVFGNMSPPDSRGSIGPMSPLSPMSGVPPLPIPPPNNAHQQQNAVPGGPNQVDLAAAMAFLMSNLPNQPPGQQNPLTMQGSLGGSLQGNPLQNPQVPRAAQAAPDPVLQGRVNQQLQQPPLFGLNLPFYPAPPGNVAASAMFQGQGDNLRNTHLADISQRIYEWTQIFEGPAIKQLTLEHQNIIRGCLTIFTPIEPGLINALNNDQISIEGLYFTPSHRRLLAQHIIALNIQVFIYYPFYPGVDRNVGNALVGITDQLYSDRTSSLHS